MARLELDRGSWTATYRGDIVTLLPKEFMLLEYLLRYNGRTFSREQLLDAVWPLETPTDRTVDDHIYRLRKKLSMWSETFELETVRGIGYRFVIKERDSTTNPLTALPAYTENIRSLMHTYIRYGRGDALLALSKHQEVFGLETDTYFRLFVMFMEGDIKSLLAADVPFSEKAAFLLHLYHHIAPMKNRRFVEEALRRNILPPMWHQELEQFNLIFMYMDWNEFDRAKEKLDAAMEEAEKHNWEGIVPYLMNGQLEYWMLTGEWIAAERQMQLIEERLSVYPYQREEGSFFILKGLIRFRHNVKEGIEWIDRGLEVLRSSCFVPHLLYGLHSLVKFSESEPWTGLRKRYCPEWERLLEETGLRELQGRIENELQSNLT